MSKKYKNQHVKVWMMLLKPKAKAINEKYVEDSNKPVTRTLAVKEANEGQTTADLHKIIEGVLKDFEIEGQVATYITDNATNMVSTVNRLNEVLEEGGTDRGESEDEEGNLEDDDDTSESDSLDESLDRMLLNLHFRESQHMRCAVHTLQLAVRDGLKHKATDKVLTKGRKVAAAARTSKIDAVLKRRLGKSAVIDQATRWGS